MTPGPRAQSAQARHLEVPDMHDTNSMDDETGPATARKPTIPEVLDRFAAYHREHPCWSGGLHVVLDEGNVSDSSVRHAVERTEGEAHDLAKLLLRMSRTQRLKLPNMVEEVNREHERRPRAQRPLGGLPADPRLAFFTELHPETWPPPADVALAQPVHAYGWTP